MAKIKHIAMSVPDPEATADFYVEAFDMKRCGTTDSPLAKGCYVTDGEINASLRKGMEPETLTMDDAVNLLEARATRIAADPTRKKVTRKKAGKKKVAKKAAKKTAS